MTIKKIAKTIRMIGDKQESINLEYHEISSNELDNMLNKVHGGKDENNLREKLLKQSKWGEK